MNAAQPAAGRRRAVRTLSLLLALALLGVIAWQARDALAATFSQADGLRFAIAVALGLLFSATQGALFAALLRKHGGSAPPRETIAAFLASQPGKYVPGRVGSPLLQLLHLRGRATLAMVAFANLELVALGLLQMTALGLACLMTQRPAAMALAVIVGIAASAWVLRANPVGALLRRWPRLAQRLGIAPDEAPAPVPWRHALGLNLAAFACNAAASWFVLAAAGAAVPTGSFAPLLATLYFGFAASLLVIVVPAGLGVREALTVAIGAWLDPGLGAAQLASLALLARAWQLAVDAASLVAGSILARSGR